MLWKSWKDNASLEISKARIHSLRKEKYLIMWIARWPALVQAFGSNPSNSTEITDNIETILKLKKEAKKIIVTPDQNPTDKLHLIDAIQRLELSYRFENEDRVMLHKNFVTATTKNMTIITFIMLLCAFAC